MADVGTIVLPRPGAPPERALAREGVWARLTVTAQSVVYARAIVAGARRLSGPLASAEIHGERLRHVADGVLGHEAAQLRRAFRGRDDWADADIGRAFALVREAAGRTLGQRPYDVQLLGAHALLRGMAAEMATGEGKTLAGGVAAAVAGLAGLPVHLVTANRYLAERDEAALRPLWRMIGLGSGVVTEAVPGAARRAVYGRDILVCTGQELAFDYMRDRLAAGRRTGALRSRAAALGRPASGAGGAGMLRGLHYAIVDEADSILIDEARTPLVLARETPDLRDAAVFDRALEIAGQMREGVGFRLFADERRVALLPAGRQALDRLAADGLPLDEPAERERLVTMALTALHTLVRDEHYLVQAGSADIIDEYSGRTMPDRTWSDDLQEMVDRKEGLSLSPSRTTEARMTYQRFFRRYRRLAGMSGTLREVAGELWRTYRLRVAAIPPHRADRKCLEPLRGHATEAAKWRAIVADVRAIHARGGPVLIGTRTVATSLAASRALSASGLHHVVLSAARPAEEAAIVADAGEPGRITVATNMAGRGTDIRLAAPSSAAGGLHVIVSEPHEAGRIDRQLAGRCGRQGDPGHVATHVSLEDALVQRHAPAVLRALARVPALPGRQRVIRLAARLAQRSAERLHARMRRDLMRVDDWLGDAIAFAGEAE